MPVDLTSRERATLRAKAHHLQPIVRVGVAGLSEAFVKEVDRALADHELIKVRLDIDDREARDEMADEICARTDAARVQRLGKILVLWRPKPDEDDVSTASS
jgi:putative YhbY family RNA-binding protein